MSDTSKYFDLFAKLGIGGIAGCILTYLAQALLARRRKKRMREQLYREISNNYHKIVVRVSRVTSIVGLSIAAPFRFADNLDLSFSAWEFYNDEKRRESFFELKEAPAINAIYGKFLAIRNDVPGYPHVLGKEAAAEVDDRQLDRTLNRGVYKHVSSLEAWRFMDDLLTGKRKSYRACLNPF